MSRILKKYSLQYQYLLLEKEDIETQYASYEVEWKRIFGSYFNKIKNEIWVNEETGEVRTDPPGTEKTKPSPKPDKLKKLYRKASTKAHPDKGGNDEDFDYIKSCYEKEDLLGLLSYAADNNIEFEIEDSDTKLLDTSINSVEREIKKMQSSLVWNFFEGSTKMKLRVIKQLEIEHQIEIDPKFILDQLET
jgi:hypothetical protein